MPLFPFCSLSHPLFPWSGSLTQNYLSPHSFQSFWSKLFEASYHKKFQSWSVGRLLFDQEYPFIIMKCGFVKITLSATCHDFSTRAGATFKYGKLLVVESFERKLNAFWHWVQYEKFSHQLWWPSNYHRAWGSGETLARCWMLILHTACWDIGVGGIPVACSHGFRPLPSPLMLPQMIKANNGWGKG